MPFIILAAAALIGVAILRDPRLVGVGAMPKWTEYLVYTALICGLSVYAFTYYKMKAHEPSLEIKDVNINKLFYYIPLFCAIFPAFIVLAMQTLPVTKEGEKLEFSVIDRHVSIIGISSDSNTLYIIELDSIIGSTYCNAHIDEPARKTLENMPHKIELELYKGFFNQKYISQNECLRALNLRS